MQQSQMKKNKKQKTNHIDYVNPFVRYAHEESAANYNTCFNIGLNLFDQLATILQS